MKIEILAADARVSQVVRATVVRRVRLALSRFGRRVQKVSVHIAEAANPLGGTDRRCQMRAWLQAAGDVRAEAINGSIDSAAGRAAARLATCVAWVLDGSHATPQGNIENRAGSKTPLTVPAARGAKRRSSPSAHPRAGKATRVRSGKR